MKRNTEADFWLKVDIGQPDECWPWMGCTNKLGYGLFRFGSRKQYLSHRLALRFSGVDLPDDKCACHKCDNPACCNPFHLFVGTNADNVSDRHRKGRTKTPPLRRGTRHNQSKLTDEQVAEIRSRPESSRILAAIYGVEASNIRMIRRRVTWSHI